MLKKKKPEVYALGKHIFKQGYNRQKSVNNLLIFQTE